MNAIGGTVNRGLYNGNISIMVTDIKDLEGRIIGATSQKSDRLMAYRYDQLNRISRAYSYGTYTEASGWAARSISTGQAFDASFAYDKNGNITSLKRYDESGNLMDNLSYNYNKTSGWLTNNRLRSVSDAVVGSASATDIESGQILDNYTYDQIGNLISDAQEGISSISWSVYGKVKKVTKVGNNSDIEFVYDAAGQRISKKIRTNNSGGSYTPANDVTTYYIRDASGNIMAVYEESSGVPTLKELPIYGSDRVGILEPGASLPVVNHFKRITRRKNYELKDHLGNVRVVISDFKSGRDRTGDSKADFYLAKVTSFSDYGPFGELLEGRTWMANGYMYGAQGQEKVEEIHPNHYTAEYWEMDSRIARRWNLDPVTNAGRSNYSVLGNNPILMIDPDGNTEYENYDAYKKAHGDKAIAEKDWTGQDGHWLASDRESWKKGVNNRFSSANEFNIKQEGGSSNYANLEQREAFYNWFQASTETKGFETRWAGGAAQAVDKLEWIEGGTGTFVSMWPLQYANNEIQDWVRAGNKLILDDVWKDLMSLYSGPILKGDDAYNWDAKQLLKEQQVIDPSYWRLSNKSLTILENSLKKNYWCPKLFTMGSPTFKGTLLSVTDRWVYGMTLMKYKVTAADVPLPPVCPVSPVVTD